MEDNYKYTPDNNSQDNYISDSTSQDINDNILMDNDFPDIDITSDGNLPPKKRNKNKKHKKRSSALTRFFAFTTALLLIFNILILNKYGIKGLFIEGEKAYSPKEISQIQNDAQDELLNNLREHLSDGNSLYTFLKQNYTSKIVYMSKGKYVFTDIDTSLKLNNFNKNNFKKDDNKEITYSENGNVVSHKGIDLSKYQGDVDFSKVKKSGVEYAILRCGYRSYGSGILNEDASFNTYAADALKNNIPIGTYFFSQAITKEEAEEEADFVLNMIKPYNVTYPVAIDIEEIDDEYRQKNLSSKELTDIVITFCEKIKKAGYTPMIYSNIKGFAGMLEMDRLEDYEKWFAGYDSTPYFPYEMSIWQYTDSGKIDGIEGNVDLNISFKTWDR